MPFKTKTAGHSCRQGIQFKLTEHIVSADSAYRFNRQEVLFQQAGSAVSANRRYCSRQQDRPFKQTVYASPISKVIKDKHLIIS